MGEVSAQFAFLAAGEAKRRREVRHWCRRLEPDRGLDRHSEYSTLASERNRPTGPRHLDELLSSWRYVFVPALSESREPE